jgi:DNA replication protein DnaC
MDKTTDTQLQYLGLNNLRQNWSSYLKDAADKKCSCQKFITTIVEAEYLHRFECRRLSRLKMAQIPEPLVMETFPFERQPQLKKKQVMELYDSMRFIHECQMLLFIGPTGCGKTGLATSYLVHAVNNQYRGYFIDFKDLLGKLYRAMADRSERKVIKQLASIDCLLIDEVGYQQLDKTQAGLFFDLIKQRHKKRWTIITSQLGFDEWASFVNDKHLTAAILDRITENCTIFNMNKCISIRQKKVTYTAEKETANK